MKKRTILSIIAAALALTLALAACAPAADEPVESAPAEEVVEEVAEVVVDEGPWADIGSEENPIIFVAVPSGETERVLAGFEQVADLIYESTGLVIEPFVATSYSAAIEAMCAQPPQAQMGALASFSYVLAAEKGCAETALVSTRFDTAFYNGQFVVRTDSGIETLEDLAGKSWCRASATSTSGAIIPGMMLKAVGIDPETDLGEMIDTGSHEAAAVGVFTGDCDFATTYVDARTREEENNPGIMDETVVIALMPDIPNDGIQFHPDFPVEVKEQLIQAFLGLFETEEGAAAMEEAYQWTGLQEHGDDFYDAFRQVLDAAGISPDELAK